MRTQSSSTFLAAIFLAVLASPGYAQYGAQPIRPAVPAGEDYHVEVSAGLWNPTPNVVISSGALGRIGSEIDFVNDLGIQKKQFGDLRITLKASRKSKFRIAYTPLSYTASTVLTRTIEFNAQAFRVSAPVDSELKWKQWRFGYEHDFVSRERGFAGLLLDVRYTDVEATLSSVFLGSRFSEFTRAKGPIPSIGGIGRVYATPNVAVTFELSALKVPKIQDKYEATYIDWDLNGVFNLHKNVGAQVGFRSLDVNYLFDLDTGDMTMRGLYFAGVVRF